MRAILHALYEPWGRSPGPFEFASRSPYASATRVANDVSDMADGCAALILAAGRGSRFGGGKMLVLINGRPMLQHVLDAAAAAELEPVVVVLGADADLISKTVAWRNESRVVNPDPDHGLSSSLAIGLNELANEQRILVLLGDQPFVSAANLRALAGTPRDPDKPIVVPRYADGKPGNPVLLEREAFPLAARLEGDRGMSQLFKSEPDLVRYVDVSGSNPDIDTQDDLAKRSPTAIVAAGYDILGGRYEDWRAQIKDPTGDRLLVDFMNRLQGGSRVLELGCGRGTPETQRLGSKFDLTGVDISRVQIAEARRRMPKSHFLVADMTKLDLPRSSFDGVVALYSLNHVPASLQPGLVARIRLWLKPGGLLMATFPASGSGDWTGAWLGVPMFFGGLSSDQNLAMLERAGFQVEVAEEFELQEPGGAVRFQWVLASVNPA
jgi:CTP:molybdopterin cytidylyltransferase MocA/SAM-dependent methyltransferase